MAYTIALASSKGGTGKTTTALHVAVALAERGHETVLVDLDPQGAIGLALARGDTEWSGLAEAMIEGAPFDGATIQTRIPQLKILPRGRLDPVDVAAYEARLHSANTVRQIVDQVGRDARFVVVDTPSGLGLATRAALATCTFVLVPLQAEPIAMRSFGQILRVIEHVRTNENPDLRLLGILPTMVQLGEETSLNVMSTLWSGFGGVFDTCVPRAEVFARSSELGIPVGFLAGRTPPEARRFDLLASEIEARVLDLAGIGEDDERQQRELV